MDANQIVDNEELGNPDRKQGRIKSRFSDYTQSQWFLLVSQMVKNYGGIQDESFDMSKIPENRVYWVKEFLLEYKIRKEKNHGE
jgi:hypothetical protein